MVLKMVRPTVRENSSLFQFRCRVPADLVERVRGKFVLVELPGLKDEPPVLVSVTAGVFIKFSLKTRDPDVARFRSSVANTQVVKHFNAWRQGPTTLPHKTLVALSGEVYRLYVEKFEENPGNPDNWAAFKAFNRAAVEGRLLNTPAIVPGETQRPADAASVFGSDLTAGVNALPASEFINSALEQRFGSLADWVLQKHGLAIDAETRGRFLQQIAQASTDAAWSLKRMAAGDYSPDPNAARFPPVRLAAAAVSLDALYEKWEAETKPSASTQTTWRGTIRSLKEQLGVKAVDITKIGADDIVAWKDASVARGLTPKTINSSYLGSANAIFNYATRNKLLEKNPADGVRVLSRTKAGRSRLPVRPEACNSNVG